MDMVDLQDAATISECEIFLKSGSEDADILKKIEDVVYTWKFSSEYDVNAIKSDLSRIIAKVLEDNFVDKNHKIYKAVHCMVYHLINENLMPLIRAKYAKEDLYLHEKSKLFCKNNQTPEECEKNVYNTLPFTAAIVELSMLDSYKSPLEKSNCLRTTYDLIFAELKSALVSVISKYSDKEVEIPVIDNEEIIPILLIVVIKSKLIYPCSNLFYTTYFADDILAQDHNIRNILQHFETVVQMLFNLEVSPVSDCNKLFCDLDTCEAMKLIDHEEETKESYTVTFKDELRKRLATLITLSTGEKNCVPIDVPKIFAGINASL